MTKARFDATKVDVEKDGICVVVGPEGGPTEELRAEHDARRDGPRCRTSRTSASRRRRRRSRRGFIKVNGHMRTREPHVYAIGDAIGGLLLAHTAGHEGIVAAHTIAGEKDVPEIDYTMQPRATYCRPEIASVGLTRAAVRGARPADQGRQGAVPGDREGASSTASTRASRRSSATPRSNDTLGVHIIGPHATDLIAETSLGLELESTPWEIGAATHPHPTLSEVIGEAAMAVDGRSINF